MIASSTQKGTDEAGASMQRNQPGKSTHDPMFWVGAIGVMVMLIWITHAIIFLAK